MEAYNYSGYGFDLVNFTPADFSEKAAELIKKVINCDELPEIAYEQSQKSNVVVDMPCNNEDFEIFINIPDISPVGNEEIKTYTVDEAKQALRKYTLSLIKAVLKDDGQDLSNYEDELANIENNLPATIDELVAHYEFQDYC